MSNVAKLKKKAAEFEQKKQFDKALALYIQILDESDDTVEEPDVALYNRVGDLLLRQGSVGDAVTYYEKAVDLYAEGGFFNNAIALCNKILRHSPGRSSIYYKLGKISAKKGFITDAKQNFLEYADRMQKGGQMDEAFRALKEFADLCPDQDDIRLMLAEQLAKKNRKGEAMEQLQSLYDKFEAEGRRAEARATVDRMKAIDPNIEPVASSDSRPRPKTGELVFLDVSYDDPPRKPAVAPRATVPVRPPPTHVADLPPAPVQSPPAAPVAASPLADLPMLETFEEPSDSAEMEAIPSLLEPEFDAPVQTRHPSSVDAHLPGLIRGPEFDIAEEEVEEDVEPAAIDGLEPTAFDTGDNEAIEGEGADVEVTTLSGREFADLSMEAPTLEHTPAPAHDLALRGELPMLDFTDDEDENALGDENIGGDLPLILPDDREARMQSGSYQALEELSPPISRTSGETHADVTLGDLVLEPTRSDAELLLPQGGSDDLPLLDVGTELEREEESVSPLAGLSPGSGAMDLQPVLGDDAYMPHAMSPLDAGLLDESVAPEGLDPAVLAGLSDAKLMGGLADKGRGTQAPDAAPPERFPAAVSAPPIAPRRPSRSVLAMQVDSLRDQVADDDSNWALRRQYAEAMLEAGDRAGGLDELELAMIGYERANDLENARSVTDEIIRLDPNSVRHHQKRVEYAFRTNDKPRLAEAYLELADALFRSGQPDKARAVYQRVLDLAPDDIRAQAALSAFVEPEPAAPPPKKEKEPRHTTAQSRRYTAELKPSAPSEIRTRASKSGKAAAATDDDFVDLGDWLREGETPKSTRMIVQEEAPSGDEQADFKDMLRKFKQGVAENVEEEDHEAHYDLGVAYKEMGLLDEAIAEFQKALRAPSHRVRSYEALGQCFMEKKQYLVAATILQRALGEQAPEDQLVGVLYLLGYASEALHRTTDAMAYYQRVFSVDIQFRDVATRLHALEKAPR